MACNCEGLAFAVCADRLRFMGLLVKSSIRLAPIDGGIVVLDIAADRYSLLSPDDPGRFLRKMAGEMIDLSPSDHTLLLQSGISTGEPEEGYSFAPAPLRVWARELPGCRVDALPEVSVKDRFATGVAIGWAHAMFKFVAFHRVLSAALHLRRHWESHTRNLGEFELAELYERHVRARTWFHSAPDRCLVNSLALLRFLAGHGVFPSWTFGVKIAPFAAHCWVEDDRFLYGEEIAYCRSFVPILSL